MCFSLVCFCAPVSVCTFVVNVLVCAGAVCMYLLTIVSPDKILHCMNTVIILITCSHVFVCACKREGGAERAT